MNPAAVQTTTPPTTSKQRSAPYDAFHAARARTDLTARLYAAAMGEDYPSEVSASSSCDWPLLGLLTARLRMSPDQLLVDAGCGTGGIGLWLARALAVRLEGFDLSPIAIAQATTRRPHFLDRKATWARFRIAELADTGLSDGCADGIVCVDVLGRSADKVSAMCELGRVLAPGGRLAMTRSLRPGTTAAWTEQAQAAGLEVEHVDERPAEPVMWERLYRLWIAHADDLIGELGGGQAQSMLREAHRMLPLLVGRRAVLLTLRRPATGPVGSPAAARMTTLDRRVGNSPTFSGRTPQ
ncbi:class I SAM-dependent DNA methyltransferase [Streptomyces aureocirculatus]|uniref:class I SAM-dependent DNA methyltransferase n=1 Tax=Streptomyces aureocirculatus TaxID=67275 RepID=UPI00068E1C3B|nr:class I SAM-dependent methyltransferase [Streptomyces aureocirculatus]